MQNQFKSIPKLACIENDPFAKTDARFGAAGQSWSCRAAGTGCAAPAAPPVPPGRAGPSLSCTRCLPEHRDAQRETVLSWSPSWPQKNSDVTHSHRVLLRYVPQCVNFTFSRDSSTPHSFHSN